MCDLGAAEAGLDVAEVELDRLVLGVGFRAWDWGLGVGGSGFGV